MSLMGAYQQAGNAQKTVDTANRVLQANPNNIRALALLAYYYRSLASQGGADAAKNADLAMQYGQKGLDALPNTPKQEGMSDADFTKFHNEFGAIFDGAVGFAALQKKDLATAQKDLRDAVEHESQPNIADIYPLATADLEAKPMNPEGFWFIVKASQLAQGAWTAADPRLRTQEVQSLPRLGRWLGGHREAGPGFHRSHAARRIYRRCCAASAFARRAGCRSG